MLTSFRTGDPLSEVSRRLAEIENEVPLPYNKYVSSYIKVYEDRKSNQTQRMLALGEHYFPMIEEIFLENGLPLELRYMAVIESALNPGAVSRVGATGLWQFMYSTALEYGLKIGQYEDERRDPEKSTRAAARYLKRMYAKYGDWLMVIASYNCGPGNVNKAIRRSGGSRDFWKIYRYLPRETRGYVPAFVGATYVMEYASALGLSPDYTGSDYLAYTPVSFRKELLLVDIIDELGLDEKMIRLANPSLIGEIIPADYALRLPASAHDGFYAKRDNLYAMAGERIEEFRKKARTPRQGSITRVVPDDPNLVPLLYTVKKGDNLGFISSWYNTGLANLKAWNGQWKNKIVIGQELIIYTHKDEVESYKRFDKLSNRQKNILSSDRQERMLFAKRFDDRYIYHEVVQGENLWLIRRQYEDVSIEDIKALNPIDERQLRPGMVLRIKENI